MNTRFLSRLVASTLCASIILTVPGSPAYAAIAEVVNLGVSAPQGPATVALPALGQGAGPAAALGASISNLGLTPSMVLSAAPAAAAASAQTDASVNAPIAAAAAFSARVAAPAAAPAASARVSPASALTPVSQKVSAALEAVGNIDHASPSSLSGLGRRLEAALTGAPALHSSADLSAAVDGPLGDIAPRGSQLARPAGDLIRQAVEARKGDSVQVPPAPSDRPFAVTVNEQRTPFWPKLISAGMALAPAIFLGWPLLAAGSTLMGGLVLAGSLALAVMPFLDESSSKLLKSLPGVAVAGLGVAALASGLYWPGAFAAVGGWGLIRYGLGKSRIPHSGALESLSAYFGGVSALTVVALAAATPAGWLAAALPYVAYPVSSLLWLHLPSWVGEGFGNAIYGVLLGVRGHLRVMTAVHRDTILMDRLAEFTGRYWTQSKWNAVWLAVMWTPIVLFEGAKWLTAAALGLYTAAVQAPVNFLWGASAKLFPKSRAAVYLAEASRFVFDNLQNGKITRFNPLEAKLLPLANSPKLASRALGSLGLSALQLGWVLYALAAAPLLSVAGLITAFSRANAAYDEERHDPWSLSINKEDSPGEKPSDPSQPVPPTEPGKAPMAPKLIAMALALVPAVYFGLPLVAALSVKALLYAALVLPLAAMPFMGPRTPSFLKSLPGRALTWNGLLLLLSGHALIAGAIAALGGWGFSRYIASRDESTGHRFDDAAELGAFFGALGSAVAIGAAWMGLMGPWGWAALGFAAVTSPLLLMHLPGWVFFGLGGAFKVLPKAMTAWHDALSFWTTEGEFLTNLQNHAGYWLKKTYWNGVWLSAIWVPTGLVLAAEFLLAVALGAVTGLVRAPFGFLAGAFEEAKPDGKAAVFFREATAGWLASAEGSKQVLEKMVSPFRSAMDEAAPVSGRPTLKAVGAFFLARLAQLVWLAGVAAMTVTGASFVVGLVRGAKAAFAKAPPSGPDAPADAASLRLPGTDRKGLWEVGVSLLGLGLAASLLSVPSLAVMTLVATAGVIALGRMTPSSSRWARLAAAAALLPVTTFIGMLGLANGSPILLGLGALALISNIALAIQVGSTRLMTNTQQTGRRMTALGALLVFASIAAIWVLSVLSPGIAVGLAGTLALLAGFVTGAALIMISLIGSLRGD